MRRQRLWAWLAGGVGAAAPLAGIGVLLAAAAHSPLASWDDGGPEAAGAISLLPPDPRIAAAKAILLENQYRYYRRLSSAGVNRVRLQDAARSYNLCSAECSPDVFRRTHLPLVVK